jgi:hypothetical protein
MFVRGFAEMLATAAATGAKAAIGVERVVECGHGASLPDAKFCAARSVPASGFPDYPIDAGILQAFQEIIGGYENS